MLEKIRAYPPAACERLLALRAIMLDTAKSIDANDQLEETLKWNEASYICKQGSTIRLDWKAKEPEQYALYFNCKTMLIETFRQVYPNEFNYADNRAILFTFNTSISKAALQHCIEVALRYHQVKRLPLLGM